MEVVLRSADFWMITVGPEPTGLVEKSPGLDGAAELCLSAVWEGSGEIGVIASVRGVAVHSPFVVRV